MLISSMTARGFTLTASCMNVPLSSENGPNDIACAQPSTSVKKAVAAFTSGTVMPVWSWPRMPGMESAKADDAAAESVSALKRESALAQLESGHLDYMCQVSSSELGLIDPCLDLCVDFVECALERGIDGAEVWKRGGEAWAQEAVVEAREEQGCPEAEFGDAIAEAVGPAFDQAVQAQAAQLISDGALRDRVRIAARQSRKMMAQVGCAKAFCELPEQDDGVPQRVDARIGKTQA